MRQDTLTESKSLTVKYISGLNTAGDKKKAKRNTTRWDEGHALQKLDTEVKDVKTQIR